jgi:ubiquinone/menaquinone biosynthesis C-methylase UbiE
MPKSQIENAVTDEYNRLAAIYDSRWNNYLSKSLSFLVEWAEIPPEAAILDVACGTGELAKLLLAKNPQQQITGIDISGSMLEVAKKKLRAYSNVNLDNTSVTSLPFADESFDIIICASAFHYFESPQLALDQMKRVLKPQGKLIILDWCRDYFFLKIVDAWLKLTDSAHQQCYTQVELNQMLSIADLDIIKHSKIRFGIIWELMAVTAVK